MTRMLGVGVFIAPALAAASAGGWLFLGVLFAVATATCCAVGTHLLSDAAPDERAGPMRVIPKRMLASTWLVGIVALLAAVGRAVGEHLFAAAAAPVATAVLLVTLLLSTAGARITRTSAVLWVVLTAVVLGIVVAASFAISPAPGLPLGQVARPAPDGVTGAAGVLFLAYLGMPGFPEYAPLRARRVATAFGIVTVAVLAVTAALLYQLGPARLALSPVPVLDALTAAGADNLRPLVAVGVAAALLPVLLAIVVSLRDTVRMLLLDEDFAPRTDKSATNRGPVFFDLTVVLAAVGLVWWLDTFAALALTACCFLVHYALVSAEARLVRAERAWVPRLSCIGVGLTVLLAMSMPAAALIGTMATVIFGPLVAGIVTRRWR